MHGCIWIACVHEDTRMQSSGCISGWTSLWMLGSGNLLVLFPPMSPGTNHETGSARQQIQQAPSSAREDSATGHWFLVSTQKSTWTPATVVLRQPVRKKKWSRCMKIGSMGKKPGYLTQRIDNWILRKTGHSCWPLLEFFHRILDPFMWGRGFEDESWNWNIHSPLKSKGTNHKHCI